MDYHIISFGAAIAFVVLLIGFLIFLCIKLKTKRPLTILSAIIIIFCFAGLYLTTPSFLFTLGYNIGNNPELLKVASKMTPFKKERGEHYAALSLIYNTDYDNNPYINGNLAIEYWEKCLEGICPLKTPPTHLYLIKGEYDKVLEIEKTRNEISHTPYAYILKEEYENALKAFSLKKQKSLPYPTMDEMLISAIYAKLGDDENYKKTSDAIYQKLIKYFDKMHPGDKELCLEKSKNFLRLKSDFLDIEAYQKYILEERKRYKFE